MRFKGLEFTRGGRAGAPHRHRAHRGRSRRPGGGSGREQRVERVGALDESASPHEPHDVDVAGQFRSGFVSLVGRPNVGKSTLVNRLVGSKVAIVSDRPQTTRTQIRGVRTTPTSQLVLLDTPGIHKPRTLLGERTNDRARSTLAEVDVVCLLIEADVAHRSGRPVRGRPRAAGRHAEGAAWSARPTSSPTPRWGSSWSPRSPSSATSTRTSRCRA